MEIYGQIKQVRDAVKAWKREGKSVGFVPTMGYLHEGHKSLIDAARRENDKVVVSIFCKPYAVWSYRGIWTAIHGILTEMQSFARMQVLILFFTRNRRKCMTMDSVLMLIWNGLTTELCGKTRPIHFRGVQTVVLKLFHIVTPDRAYFGQKDAQQPCCN